MNKVLYYYTVYALSDCGYCARAISKLGELGLDHLLIIMDKAPDYREKIKKKYDHQTVPAILRTSKANEEDVEFVGGFDDLVVLLDSEGYGED